jgi:peptidoglycan hydrolase-like protein with peptidoglycan-binding domain
MWSWCLSSNQTRSCADLNGCGSTTGEPAVSQTCTSYCTFNGQTIADGSTVTAYQSAIIPTGTRCSSETRVCSAGVLSGDFQFASCGYGTPPPANCTPNWSCNAWSSCLSGNQTRSCVDLKGCASATGIPAASQSCTLVASPPAQPPPQTPVAPTVPVPIALASSSPTLESAPSLLLLHALVPGGSCPALSRTLSYGSRGADVVALQNFLISQSLLPAGTNTGYYGALTRAAVQAFQRTHNIASSGTSSTTGYGAVGPHTRAIISCRGSVVPTSPATSNPTPSPVAHARPRAVSVAAKYPNACLSIQRTLALDDRGGDVQKLQQYLSRIGLLDAIQVTGYFNTDTQHALQQWQKAEGIVSSGSPATTNWGVVGPKTRAVLAHCN